MVPRRGSVACISSSYRAGQQIPRFRSRFSVADLRHHLPAAYAADTINVSPGQQRRLLSVREDETKILNKRVKFHLEQNSNEIINSTWLRYVRIYLVNAIKLCQYNPAGDDNDGFGPSIKRSKLPLWSRLADLFWLYFSIKMLILQILQHRYSTIMYEIKMNDESATTTRHQSASSNRTSERQLEGQLRLEKVIAQIEFVGNPLYELGFALEGAFVFILFLIYIAKVHNPLHAALRTEPIRIGLVQMLLDSQREHRQTTWRNIELLVDKFLISSKNYCLAQVETIWRVYEELGPKRPSVGMAQGHPNIDHKIILAKDQTIRLMGEMLASGELVPPNRRPAWLLQMAHIYLGLVMYFTFLGVCLTLGVLVVLPTSGVLKIRLHTSARDLLTLVELICYCLVGLQWVIFYLALVIALALDQMKFVVELRRLIASLIGHVGSYHYERITTVTDEGESFSGRNLDRPLLRVLILYKLFKLQLSASQPVVGFIGSHMVFLTLLLPLMGRLYAAHLSPEVRYTHLACSLFFIICADYLVLPNCMLHARCLDLFRDLSSLLAQLDAAARFARTREWQNILAGDGGKRTSLQSHKDVLHADGHAIWLLRRELHLPELALRRFATRAYFMNLTYSSWLGVHFWGGLLLAPLILNDTDRLVSLGNLSFIESIGLF